MTTSSPPRTAQASNARGRPRVTSIVDVPDEAVFGIVSRWHRLSGNRSPRDTLFELLGTTRVRTTNIVPGRLDRLFVAIGFDPDTLDESVEAHTALPYWKPFVDVDRYIDVLDALRHSPGRETKLRLGVVASRLGASNPALLRVVCRGGPRTARRSNMASSSSTSWRVHVSDARHRAVRKSCHITAYWLVCALPARRRAGTFLTASVWSSRTNAGLPEPTSSAERGAASTEHELVS